MMNNQTSHWPAALVIALVAGLAAWTDTAWARQAADDAAAPGTAADRSEPAEVIEGDMPLDRPGPRDGEGPWRRDGRSWADRIGPEQIDAALDVLDEVDPELAARVRQYRQQEPEAVLMRLRPHLPGLMRLVHLKQSDPEHYALRVADTRLERQTLDLSRQHREAAQRGDEAAAAELRESLRQALAEHFDVRQRLREKMLADLKKRVEQMQQQIQQRQSARQELIEQRLGELTGQAAGPRW